jgi:hypothetical protein
MEYFGWTPDQVKWLTPDYQDLLLTYIEDRVRAASKTAGR